MGRILTDEVIDAAYQWLVGSSEDIAAAKANMIRAEFKLKRVHARLYLQATGTIESKKAQATVHPEYEEATERYAQAVEVWERALDQRNRAELILEMKRTEEVSARAAGKFR